LIASVQQVAVEGFALE